ncbi:MAG: hypothetical protein CMN56_01550 [Sneathiella sp.]|uniref:Hpt domain-containing protein n=1 Tax=Sneathiella sp. TaxID=1964365 RepID=UPI000C440C4C|nr:Hpt domain-containing protein [Sneathiella sp.]MAZ01798.1 hypothetical protein [Sneathiella sp.]
MTKIVKMEGYEIHHPVSDLKRKASKGDGLSLKEIEKRIAKKMGALEEEFLSGVPPVIKSIEDALDRLEKGQGGIVEQKEIFRQGHDLKGMGGSFGYPIMGTIGSAICQLSNDDIETKNMMLPLIRVHLDLLIYVNAHRIKDDTDPKAAPILAALENAKTR